VVDKITLLCYNRIKLERRYVMKNEYKEKYKELLMQYQLIMSGVSLKELKIYVDAINDYYEQRKMCDLMCGGVENDYNI
jgi:hypothetical protein